MEKKKLSTEEILAAARAQSSGGKAAGGESAAKPKDAAVDPAEPSPTPEPAATEAPKPASTKPAGKPTSTADILAAARAQSAGGAAKSKPVESTEPKPAAADKPAVKPAGKPASTADILAAARAQTGGRAAEPAEKPAAKAAPSKPAAPAKPAGDKPSVQEMLKAVREGKPAEPAAASAAPAKPALPPTPQKPSLVRAADEAPSETRRNILVALVATPFAIAWTALSATLGVSTLALARFMFPNVLVEPPMRFKIGPASDYPPGAVSTKWTPSRGVWIAHSQQYNGRDLLYALISTCTHLGCTPNWLEGEQKFKCPCHGSGFYISGINFEGPAPRPLERCGIRIAPDGMLEVDKSLKFQEEKGQWEDAASFVEVA